MEIEAKFIVPGEEAFRRLRAIRHFGAYIRGEVRTKVVRDRYMDTPSRRFYARNFAVRLRESADGTATVATLKQLTSDTPGALHSRAEYETRVGSANIDAWPDSEARTVALSIAQGDPLLDYVAIAQTRHVSVLAQGDRRVAELSLDEVTISSKGEPVVDFELELELLPAGDLSDLEAISSWLVEHYGLKPQPLSKLERALPFAEL